MGGSGCTPTIPFEPQRGAGRAYGPKTRLAPGGEPGARGWVMNQPLISPQRTKMAKSMISTVAGEDMSSPKSG